MQSRKEEAENPLLNASTLAILKGYQLLTSNENSKIKTDNNSNTSGKLCAKCLDLLQELKSFTVGVGDEREMSELKEGAKIGCPLCSMFHANLGSLNEEWLKGFEGKPHIFITLAPNFRLPFSLQPEAVTPLKFVGHREQGDLKFSQLGSVYS